MTARGSRGSSLAVSVLVTVLAVAGAIVLVIRLPGRAGEMADKAAAQPLAVSASPAPVSRERHAGPGQFPLRVPERQAGPARQAAQDGRAERHTGHDGPGGPHDQRAAGRHRVRRHRPGAGPDQPGPGPGRAARLHDQLRPGHQRRPAHRGHGRGLRPVTPVPGRASPGRPGDRGRRAWTAAGENIGEGGPVAATPAAIAQMAVGLTQSMLDEKPPDDGHRLNILSSAFTHIGISVYRDSSGTVWMTQDFSN